MPISDPIQKLLSIGSDALSGGEPVRALVGSDGDRSLGGLLRRRNGFYAFESALHVFASAGAAPGRSLEEWNDPGLWKHAYGDLAPSGVCFAEDIFGGQFVLVDAAVHTFDPETAQLSLFSDSVEDWAYSVLDRYDFVTGHSVAHEWQAAHGALPAGHRLFPRVPFVLGGEFAADNMVPIEASAAMRYLGRLAREASDLPDGSRLMFDHQLVDGLACARWGDEGSDCACFAN